MCTSWQCPVLLDKEIYTQQSMDASFPTVYYKTSSYMSSPTFPACLQYNDSMLKLSATVVVLPLLLAYFAVGCCCLCISLANPVVNHAGHSYNDFQARQEARRRSVAAEQEGARKIAHRIGSATNATEDVSMDGTEVTIDNPFRGLGGGGGGGGSSGSGSGSGGVELQNTATYSQGKVLAVVSPTTGQQHVHVVVAKTTTTPLLTPNEQFQMMVGEITSWSGDTVWMCDVLQSLTGLIQENPSLRQQELKLQLIQTCKRKRMDYPKQWNSEVAALFGQCLVSFSFMGSIGLPSVEVQPLRSMLSIGLSRARSISLGTRGSRSGGAGGGGKEAPPQSRENSVQLKDEDEL